MNRPNLFEPWFQRKRPLITHRRQENAIASGASLFRATCSVAYCDTAAGTAGRAPKLAGRSFAADRLINIIPKTAMPGFKNEMNDDRIGAIAF
jgi:mono/diheme cytochrome c family protein